MVNTSSEISELYKFVLSEQRCAQLRHQCTSSCKNCNLYKSPALVQRYYNQLLDMLKARQPDLMFLDQLAVLSNRLGGPTDVTVNDLSN